MNRMRVGKYGVKSVVVTLEDGSVVDFGLGKGIGYYRLGKNNKKEGKRDISFSTHEVHWTSDYKDITAI